MQSPQEWICDIGRPSVSSGAACADVATPVPLFEEPVLQPAFCLRQARESIAAALKYEDESRLRTAACPLPAVEQLQPRPTRGARKRKACHPKRSDDGCEATRQIPPPLTSTDEEFALRMVKGVKSTKATASAVRKRCSGGMQKKRGLSADEAIAANQKRANRRKRKSSGRIICSVIVSGVVVPLTPVHPCPGVRHARGTLPGVPAVV